MRNSPVFLAAIAAAVVALAALGSPSGAEEEGTPTLDLAYYKARVAPIVHTYCGSCHSGRRGRAGRLILLPRPGRQIEEEHHEANFERISRLIEPGNPSRSPFLLKGLGPAQGGLEHGGGPCLEKGSTQHETLLAFIGGATLDTETVPETARPHESGSVSGEPSATLPSVGPAGLTIPARNFELDGDLTLALHPDHPACAKPGKVGGSAITQFHLPEAGAWLVTLGVAGPGEGMAWRIDGQAARILPAVGPGAHGVGTDVVLDHAMPLVSQTGRLSYDGAWLSMQGRHGAPASWLVPTTSAHERVETTVRLPTEAKGGDDALLLFDMRDIDNGKFVGLIDAGRRFVMGVLEGGLSRVVASVNAPTGEAGAVRTFEVEFLEGVAVGSLDGRALIFLHLDRHLRSDGRLGLRTHGTLHAESIVAEGPENARSTSFSQASTVKMRAGSHRIRVDLPPSAPSLMSLTIRRGAE